MKVKVMTTHGEKEVPAEVTIPDLIAELERRRPNDCANRCEHIGSEVCGACIWGLFIGEEPGGITDNFKPSKGEK